MSSARIFQHNDMSGSSFLINNSGGDRYMVIPFAFLNALGFNDLISSVRLRPTGDGIKSSLLLFEHDRFAGRVKALAFDTGRDAPSLPDFNDTMSSIVLMDHPVSTSRSILQLGALAGDQINSAIDAQLSGIAEVTRSGNVALRFVIDLFEVSRFGEDLMLMEVPITIHTPWPFSDYRAKIRYWIKFFIDSESRLQGFVAAWGYWIEGGILTGSIESRLVPQVEANIGAVETELNNSLRELNWHRWTDVYLMPGNASVDTDYLGHVDDDCAVVLPYEE